MSDNQVPAPPGYYDDGTGNQRYWDGQHWAGEGVLPQPQTQVLTPGQPITYAHAPAVKQRNVLGIVALVVAAFGFVFACIPGALIIGWIALPIAFVLAIVALFLKGKGKALALTALIISVVGTIIGFVVFFAVVAASFNDAFGDSGTSVTQPKSSSAAKSSESDSGSNEAKVGTRDNPAAIGSQITSGDYTVTVNSVELNATDKVMAANEFNDEPDSGTAYALINVTVKYTGKDSGNTSYVGVAYVTASGNVINDYDKMAMGPDPAFGGQELYPGASATGNVVIQVPTGDSGLIRIRPGIVVNEIFVKTH